MNCRFDSGKYHGDCWARRRGQSNAMALDVLHGGFKNKAPVAYYKAGDTPTLPPDLVNAGLTAQILGPPTICRWWRR